MNFVKKVFEGNIDESVHLQFQKFSKGEFRNRALIKLKKTGGRYNLSAGAEFANELVRVIAEKLGSEKTKVTGAIVSTQDLKDYLNFKEIKQFQGVKRYLIDSEMSGDEIINLLNKFPKNFFALSFSVPEGSVLKIKPKAPKSGKPGKGDEAPKADFCSLKTTDSKIGKSFVFEIPDFKEAKITHHFIINELIYPEGETDYSKIRELAKRKCRIIRDAVIDGQKIKSEKEFEA